MLTRITTFCDRLIVSMARRRNAISVGYMVAGIILLMVSFGLGIHDVQFTGETEAGFISGITPGVAKQVGYVWAPNWALASIFILPLAIYNILAARRAADTILPTLLNRKMLRRRDENPVDSSKLSAEWRRTTAVWSTFALLCMVGAGLFVLLADFLPVVGNWLSSPEFRGARMEGLTIGHPDYEFDWSIAALYPGEMVPAWANYIFSLLVYLLIPIFGAGFIFGMFMWFVSISAFFSFSRLREDGYVIIPDLESDDVRSGFEIFEDLFDSLLRAGLMTAAMALCMHYQNVFLRTASHENILQMLFNDALIGFRQASKGDFSGLLNVFGNFLSIVETQGGGTSLQTYATALVNVLIFVIVMGLMWRWLRKLAIGGLEYTSRNIAVTAEQKKRLERMEIWPVGWISEALVAVAVLLTLAAMYFVGLLPIFLLALILFGAKGLLAAALEPFKLRMGRKRPIQWADEDGDDK